MKVLALVLMMVSGSSAFATSYVCEGSKVRMGGKALPAESNFKFRLYAMNGVISMRSIVGSIVMDDSTNEFKIDLVNNNPKYRPTRYKNSIQFLNVNSTTNTGPNAEQLYGSLVIERRTTIDNMIPAHYLFQVDQGGGTIDLACREEIN